MTFTVATSAWSQVGVDVSDARNADEACTKAGLDWTVVESDLTDDTGSITGYKSLRRSDNGGLLSVMRNSYTPVNNDVVFRLLDPFIRDRSLTVDTATELEGGRKVILNFKINDLIADVTKDDPIEGYLNAYNGHDGLLSWGYGFHIYRLWCMNQQPRALSYQSRSGWQTDGGVVQLANNGKAIKFRHTRNVMEYAKNLPDIIDLKTRQFNTTLDELRYLASKPCDLTLFRRILDQTYAPQIKAGDHKDCTGLKFYDNLVQNFDAGVGSEAHRGTLYGAVQAVAEYHTHQSGRASDEIERARKRLNALWFGNGDTAINRCADTCLTLA
ncbi:DUF932 domain-containing protein [Synechococcus elongatus]|uniref:DUF932 domain-containing protein n=1 Tax=Synechococcus elongatus TaxID=32046 RepID=UPI00137501C5|nr:DUF932 domain-containing protein [Synechococcus elongatus]